MAIGKALTSVVADYTKFELKWPNGRFAILFHVSSTDFRIRCLGSEPSSATYELACDKFLDYLPFMSLSCFSCKLTVIMVFLRNFIKIKWIYILSMYINVHSERTFGKFCIKMNFLSPFPHSSFFTLNIITVTLSLMNGLNLLGWERSQTKEIPIWICRFLIL